MGEAGCVGWMFDRKGVVTVDKDKISEEQIMELGLEAGAEDVIDQDTTWEVRAALADFEAVRSAFEEAGIEIASAEMAMIPQNTIEVDAQVGQKLLNLVDMLEDNDDVQNVWANFDLSDEAMAELA
jgi:transcriptional/translational regulatory protein YebC/TACO1